jgi:hypothetical protein
MPLKSDDPLTGSFERRHVQRVGIDGCHETDRSRAVNPAKRQSDHCAVEHANQAPVTQAEER